MEGDPTAWPCSQPIWWAGEMELPPVDSRCHFPDNHLVSSDWFILMIPAVIFVSYWGKELTQSYPTRSGWNVFWLVLLVVSILWGIYFLQTNFGPTYDDPNAPDCTPTKFVDC